MAFELIPKKAPKSSVDPAKVYFRSRTMHFKKRKGGSGGGQSKFYLLAIGSGVAKGLGWGGDTHLSILWGTDRDLGKVQVVPSDDGAWTPRVDKLGNLYVSTGAAVPSTCAFADFPNKAVAFSTSQVGAAPKPKYLQLELPSGFHAKGR